ncbi:hypothetical protein B0H13DRAFT_1904078 [Mycena leptocephala]|nr:hypothetical protein B0H13DRAFT_1904078 [Mycena leptocephala]
MPLLTFVSFAVSLVLFLPRRALTPASSPVNPPTVPRVATSESPPPLIPDPAYVPQSAAFSDRSGTGHTPVNVPTVPPAADATSWFPPPLTPGPASVPNHAVRHDGSTDPAIVDDDGPLDQNVQFLCEDPATYKALEDIEHREEQVRFLGKRSRSDRPESPFRQTYLRGSFSLSALESTSGFLRLLDCVAATFFELVALALAAFFAAAITAINTCQPLR